MKLRPIQDRIVVKRDKAEDKTPGGIIIPDNVKEKCSQGVVVAVGPGKVDERGRFREPFVKAGDRVLFGKYQGTEIIVDGESLIAMCEDDILGVFED